MGDTHKIVYTTQDNQNKKEREKGDKQNGG
jgi:hypothetical protein